MKNEESTALAHPPTTPTAPGRYWPPNLILMKSLHLKYTCGKRAVSNSSSLYTLFYSVIYNSVVRTKRYRIANKDNTVTYRLCGTGAFDIPWTKWARDRE